MAIFGQTTTYRFPDALRARRAFDSFTGRSNVWSWDVEQGKRLCRPVSAAEDAVASGEWKDASESGAIFSRFCDPCRTLKLATADAVVLATARLGSAL